MRFVKQVIAAAVAGSFGLAALAQEPASRAQISAETRAAVAAGQIPYGEVTRAEARAFVPSKSLAEARAEAAAAVASNQIPYGEVSRFADASGIGASRAQVRGETIEAMRRGLIPYGEVPVRAATAADLESIRVAGVRALRVNGEFAAR